VAVVVLLALIACAVYWVSQLRRANQVHLNRQYVQKLAYDVVLESLGRESRMFDLPRGDTRSLYRWIAAESYRDGAGFRPRWFALVDTNDETFRDLWGHELVYRFPSNREGGIMDLYSVGPNGRDEGGVGDDVTAGDRADFEGHRILFLHGRVDPAWIWEHLDSLKRAPGGGIIGAPDAEP